jgi:hypothetical protein
VILVDTSVWIELLGGRRDMRGDDMLRFATCGPVVQEVLQGLRESAAGDAFREAVLALPRLGDPLPLDVFLEAAEIYRLGRRKGYTIRSAIDCLIAAVAIRNRTPVWHKDRDYTAIARYTSLQAVEWRAA